MSKRPRKRQSKKTNVVAGRDVTNVHGNSYQAGRDINKAGRDVIKAETVIMQTPLSRTAKAEQRLRNDLLERSKYLISFDRYQSLEVQKPIKLSFDIQWAPRQASAPHVQQKGISPDIAQIYGQTRGSLLLLGEPGAGKSLLLQELALSLLEKARQDESSPIPVILHLVSWTEKKEKKGEQYTLDLWLFEELTGDKWGMPRKFARQWIEDGTILPLLDGLDEVNPLKERVTCAQAINTYGRQEQRGSVALVVSCRKEEYEALTTKVRIQPMLRVRALTDAQIEEYLQQWEEKSRGLRSALADDEDLHKLAETPLMLDILRRTYEDTPATEIVVTGSKEAKRQQVWENYVKRMFVHWSDNHQHEPPYKPRETLHYLSWLAKQLRQRSLTEFYLERIDPSWLLGNWASTLSPKFLVKLICVGLITLVTWLGIILGFSLPFAFHLLPLHQGLGLQTYLTVFCVFVLLSLVLGIVMNSLELNVGEKIGWDRQLLRYTFRLGVQLSALLGLVSTLTFWLVTRFSLDSAIVGGMMEGLICLPFICFVAGGIYSELVDERTFILPSEGLHHSVRASITGGIVGTMGGGLCFGFFGLLLTPMNAPLRYPIWLLIGLPGAIVLGIFFWWYYGGRNYVRNFILRKLLHHANCIPKSFPTFLNYAHEMVFLIRAGGGGGYAFRHNELQEYFAKLNNIPNTIS